MTNLNYFKRSAAYLAIAAFLSLSACCNKSQCSSINTIHRIDMVGFTKDELSSIGFETFTGGSNFTERIDSTVIKVDSFGNSYNLYIELPVKFDPSIEYRITPNGSKNSYDLAGFVTDKIACSKCADDNNDDYIRIRSYYLNGEKKKLNELRIDKK